MCPFNIQFLHLIVDTKCVLPRTHMETPPSRLFQQLVPTVGAAKTPPPPPLPQHLRHSVPSSCYATFEGVTSAIWIWFDLVQISAHRRGAYGSLQNIFPPDLRFHSFWVEWNPRGDVHDAIPFVGTCMGDGFTNRQDHTILIHRLGFNFEVAHLRGAWACL